MMPSARLRDVVGRALMTFYFAFAATVQAASILEMLSRPNKSAVWALDTLASIAVLGFLVLIVATTVARLPPKNSAAGIEPRISALIGAFAMVTLAAFPRVETSDQLRPVANVITLVGAALGVWCVWWLGRSFSIMAQARRLVTSGPYRLVRHPLYACEAIILAGIILRNPAWPTLVIAAIGLSFQYRRILNEERVLSATFPEYASYAKRVPMLGVSRYPYSL